MATNRRNDVLIPAFTVAGDALAIEGAFLLSYWLRFQTSILHFLPLMEEVPPLDAYMYSSFVVIPCWLLIFNARKMYGARRNIASSDELIGIIKACTLGMMVIMSAAFFVRFVSYSRVVFGLLWVTSVILIFTGRMLMAAFERWLYRHGRELRNAVIVGTTETANQVYAALGIHPLLGYRIVGYLAASRSMEGDHLSGAAYLGTIADVAKCVHEHQVELVLVALDPGQHEELVLLVRECEGINVECMLVPDFIRTMSSRMTVTEIGGIPFVRLKGVPMTSWGRFAKRTFDCMMSALILVLLSPLFLIMAFLIKLGSRGPVFFTQTRIGIDGRNFTMYKFRSMVTDAEKASGPVWAKHNDPRQTALGKFLRRTSLDELPQLFNVLKGEMSLVGPRPERPFFVEQFSKDHPGTMLRVPKYLDRHRVRTGMTGWAQVNGLRGNTSVTERIQYDLYYIENWSFGFDLKILLKTVGALIRHHHP